MNVEVYHLIAYELGTDNEVINWLNVALIRRFNRDDLIVENDTQWRVIGVRNTSTEELHLVDVKKVVRE